jgi:hypothetical protein
MRLFLENIPDKFATSLIKTHKKKDHEKTNTVVFNNNSIFDKLCNRH